MNNIKENFVSALEKSLYIIVVKLFTMPLNILDRSITSVMTSDGNDSESDFPVLIWVKKMYDGLIVLSYPLGILVVIIISAIAGFRFDVFILQLVMTYFCPIAIGLIKEIISIAVINVVKLEEIARNTKKD